MPRSSVYRDDQPRPGCGVAGAAATTSGPAAAELAELTNVVVAHRMSDCIAPPGLDGVSALRNGEFMLTVKDPPRVVPRAAFVRARHE